MALTLALALAALVVFLHFALRPEGGAGGGEARRHLSHLQQSAQRRVRERAGRRRRGLRLDRFVEPSLTGPATRRRGRLPAAGARYPAPAPPPSPVPQLQDYRSAQEVARAEGQQHPYLQQLAAGPAPSAPPPPPGWAPHQGDGTWAPPPRPPRGRPGGHRR